MPIYVYECRACHKIFEIEQRITEDPLTTCGECKGEVKRVIQPVGIGFKGSGFHINDYAPSSGGGSESSGSSESASSD